MTGVFRVGPQCLTRQGRHENRALAVPDLGVGLSDPSAASGWQKTRWAGSRIFDSVKSKGQRKGAAEGEESEISGGKLLAANSGRYP